jgi:hypothetical protein
VHRLRAAAPRGTVRLSRLTQDLPNVEIGIGWLLELELPDDDPLLTERRLAEVLTDMRLLGLQPTLLTPQALPGNGRTPVERYTTAPMAAGRAAGQDPD